MPLNPLIAAGFRYQPAADQDKTSLLQKYIDAQKLRNEAQAAEDTSRASGLASDYNEKTMGSRVAQAANTATGTGLDNQGKVAEMPVKNLAGQQAGIESGMLGQMFPGQNIPPQYQQAQPAQNALPMSRESDAQPGAGQPGAIPPAIANQFASKSLTELLQMKANAGPAGEFLGKFIDPMITRKILTEKQTMYDDLNSPEWKAKISGIGTRNTNGSNAFNEFRKAHPIIEMLPETEQAKIQTESFKANAQPNMAMMLAAPIPATAMDNAAKRIANRESTVSEEMAKGFSRRPDAFQLHDQLVNQVKQNDPNFTEQDTEAGAAFAKAPATRRYVAAIDNARSTASRIMELAKSNGGTQSPMLNELINKFKVQAGDVDAAKVAIGQLAGTEEYSGAFTRSGGGSETTRGWADELGKLIYQQPKQAQASSSELLRAFDRNRQALMKQGGGYIKKPDYKFLDDEGKQASQAPQPGAKGPLSKAEAHWYLDQSKGDPKAAMAAATRDGRTF